MKYGDMNKEQAEVIFEKELRNFKKYRAKNCRSICQGENPARRSLTLQTLCSIW